MQKPLHLTFLLVLTMAWLGLSAQKPNFAYGSSWKYLDNGSNQGTTWKDASFNDATWASANAPLGYGAYTVSTGLSFGSDANNKHITSYFRKKINVSDLTNNILQLTARYDDGGIIYVNGLEVGRFNMPAGNISHTTLANSPAIGSTAANFIVALPASNFVIGENTIAVEIHQQAVTSSDLYFDLELKPLSNKVDLPLASNWKYLDNGSNQGTAWSALSFDDNTWKTGAAPLGYSYSGLNTTTSFGSNSSNKFITTYFRKKIQVSDFTNYTQVTLTARYDDGGIVYLNGIEVGRFNMPSGTVTHTTLANSPAIGSTAATFTLNIPTSQFVSGENLIAVELHQQAASSSDTYFDLSLEAIINDVNLFPSASSWKYFDDNSLPANNWFANSFEDNTWNTGAAPLGYGNGNEGTTINAGNVLDKNTAAYFRKSFAVNDLNEVQNLALSLKRDDGVIVYLNGIEVYRNNLPTGTISHNTLALSPIEGNDETSEIVINIAPSALLVGQNTIAVELHKFNKTESDLAFDLAANLQYKAKTLTPASTFVDCNPNESATIGCFTSVRPQAQTAGLTLPSTHTFQMIAQQGITRYTNSSRLMPTNNDFTGYIASGGSSKEGIVAINHENSPGDVSLVSLHLNDSNKLWVVDSARLVDFAPLVRTERNCSGGLTPWGTTVTSEENYSTGDVNGDGYQDRGWQVEIDPISGKIKDYDNDGKPDKLWAMGRMSHENFAINAAGTIAYETEDGGSNGVYKYVLDNAGDLSSGKLYGLKRDNATSTTGTWVLIPNTTQSDRNTTSNLYSSLGCTNWSNPEDIEFGPDGKMYFTAKTPGIIWRFKDEGATVSGIEQWVTNANYPIAHAEGVVNESWGTGIDNLTFDGEGNLWALQDGGRGHLWVVRPDHTPANPHIELFAVTPSGSESTGLTFTPDFKYGFISIQHPSGSLTAPDAAGNNVRFNVGSTLVFARKEDLGNLAVAPMVNLGNDTVICRGNTLSLSGNNGADVLNAWNTSSTQNSITVSETGMYKVTAYANNGKQASDSIMVRVQELPVIEQANVQQCGGTASLLAGDGNFSYSWSNGSTASSIIVDQSGAYTLTKTDEFGCQSSKTIQVVIKPSESLNLGEDIVGNCGEDAVTINSKRFGYNYSWSTGVSTPNAVVRASGTYLLTITNPNTGCQATDSINVVLKQQPRYNLADELSACGNELVISPNVLSSNVNYLWNTGETSKNITAKTSGIYTLAVTNSEGCSVTDSVKVTLNPLPLVNLGADTVICPTCQLVLDAGPNYATYLWNTGATTQTIVVKQNGTYSVSVNDNKQCSGRDEITVSGITGISGTKGSNIAIDVFPNPFSGVSNIKVINTTNEPVTASLKDITGKELSKLIASKLSGNEILFTVDANALQLAKGIYLVNVTVGNNNSTVRITLQ